MLTCGSSGGRAHCSCGSGRSACIEMHSVKRSVSLSGPRVDALSPGVAVAETCNQLYVDQLLSTCCSDRGRCGSGDGIQDDDRNRRGRQRCNRHDDLRQSRHCSSMLTAPSSRYE